MSYLERDTYGMYRNENESGPGPRLMGAETLIGNDVYNLQDEDLGDIKEIMLDMESGEVCYAVLSFGGFLGIADKLFAVPWSALKLDTENQRFTLDVDKKSWSRRQGLIKMTGPIWLIRHGKIRFIPIMERMMIAAIDR